MGDPFPLELGGARQWIAVHGEEGAPLLLYLHGGPGIAELATMRAFVPALLPEFQVVGWDQRGAGRSRAADVTLERLVGDLVELVAHLRRRHDPPRLILMGHSWGALLGLLALRHEPSLADGLVAIGPQAAGAANEVASHRLALAEARRRGPPLLGRLLRREPPPYGADGGAALRQVAYLWALGGVMRPRSRLLGLAWRLATFRGYGPGDKALYLSRAARAASRLGSDIADLDLRDAPLAPPVPILACTGRHDLVTPPALARAALGTADGAEIEWRVFEGAAHSPHYEDPAGFAAVLRAWHERRWGPPVLPRRRALVRERVLRLGWNANAYQALGPRLSHWLAPDRDAAVGYVRHAGVRVAAGGPVAREEDLAEVAAAFEADARRDGERVCWFGAEERLAVLLAARGDHARILLGGQPVWDPRGWGEAVRTHRTVRSQLSRARNKGLRVEAWPDPTAAQLAALRDLEGEWLARKALPSLHFLTEPDTLRFLRDRRLLVASVGGRPVGFLVASPVPTRAGWLVEQVVRTAAAPNGTAESLVDGLMRSVAAEGARYATLGLVPLARRPELPRETPPPWLALTLRLVRAHGHRFYRFAGLEYFKAKLAPDRWDPVWAIADEARFSPRTLYAIAAAFAGGSPVTFVARALARAAGEEARGLPARLRRGAGR